MSCFIPSQRRRDRIVLPDSPGCEDVDLEFGLTVSYDEKEGLISYSIASDSEHEINHGFESKQKITDDREEELIKRLSDLQKEVQEAKVDWYVVPSEDEHQSEEVGESDQRRAWISGFTGSAGTAIIPASSSEDALLFVDSRYWIQAAQQVPPGWEVVRVGSQGGSGKDAVTGGWADWVVRQAEDGTRIGIDPKLISLASAKSIQSRLSSEGSSAEFIAIKDNLVDRIRTLEPRALGPLNDYPLSFSGESTESKLGRARAALSDHLFSVSRLKQTSDWIYILPTLPSIAWLLNFRCPSDIPFCPVAYAYAVLTPDSCVIFVDERKVQDGTLRTRWEDQGVEVKPYGVDEVGKYVTELLSDNGEKARDDKKKKVLAPRECSWALSESLPDTKIEIIPCPIDKLKGVKNSVEQQGFRNAYLRDGRAMVRWMAWLEKTILKEQRKVGEWAAAQTLTRYRRREELFAGLAYEDISASGPNGALPHYAPQRGQDRLVDIDSTYVIDSGAQYSDGTIDTTRTLYLGAKPSDEVKRAYTRVLQGHMAVSTAVFPRGMPADRLNMLARGPLYQDGLDFGHGIGHGIGTYLAVHENPMFPRDAAFEPGNITSIEPGYYKEGEWGIRIESVILCKEVETSPPEEAPKPAPPSCASDAQDQAKFLTFERITQVPIQTSLVNYSLLTKDEIRWLNAHNTSVQDALWPSLQGDEDADARDWLKRVCKPKKIWPWTGA